MIVLSSIIFDVKRSSNLNIYAACKVTWEVNINSASFVIAVQYVCRTL